MLALSARMMISALFLYSGGTKLLDPESFARAIQGYQMVSMDSVLWMTWVLPWLEVWCSVALWVTPAFRRSAWSWIGFLLVVFTLAKISAVLRGLDISCGCTGTDSPLTWASVFENLIWLAVTGVGLCLDRRYPRLP